MYPASHHFRKRQFAVLLCTFPNTAWDAHHVPLMQIAA
jgi:hypothetical protein